MTPPGNDAAIKQAMAMFCQQHQTSVGSPYMIQWGKDQKIMKDIITTYGTNKSSMLISLFFQALREDTFLQKTGASVGIMKTQIPKLLMKINEKEEKTQIGRL
jgi:hypothetical protein